MAAERSAKDAMREATEAWKKGDDPARAKGLYEEAEKLFQEKGDAAHAAFARRRAAACEPAASAARDAARANLRQRLEEAVGSDLAGKAIETARWGAAIRAVPADRVASGTSRFGGPPSEETGYGLGGDDSTQYAGALCVSDFERAHCAAGLPPGGAIAIVLGENDASVVFARDEQPAAEAKEGSDAGLRRLCAIEWEDVLFLPPPGSPHCADLPAESKQAYEKLLREIDSDLRDRRFVHRLLGYPTVFRSGTDPAAIVASGDTFGDDQVRHLHQVVQVAWDPDAFGKDALPSAYRIAFVLMQEQAVFRGDGDADQGSYVDV